MVRIDDYDPSDPLLPPVTSAIIYDGSEKYDLHVTVGMENEAIKNGWRARTRLFETMIAEAFRLGQESRK